MFNGRPLRSRFVRIAALGLVSAVLTVGSAAAQTPQTQTPAKGKKALAATVRAQLRGARLTTDQKQQLRGIFQAHQPEIKALREKAKALRETRKAGGQVNPQDLRDLKTQRQTLTKALRQEAMKVLTPEQQKRLRALRKRLIRRLGRV